MRRLAGLALVLLCAAGLLLLGTGADEGDQVGSGDYEVRAIFDNGGFLVEGEEVRVSGAKVGVISDVDVSMPGEAVHADGSDDPGKAVVVLRIDDAGFRDFRQDASCLIRPQSFIGEKYVECEPTQPRAAASEPPPQLERIPEGEAGEGQYLLPVEQNGKAVDLDLVNNIMREPYPDRFRLILNDLGAGFATRGDELAEIIERSNPALRETNEVLAILARQNRSLAQLAEDGDRVLAPLARDRERIVGFLRNATTAGQATAERGAALERSFERLPEFLEQTQLTMARLRGFTDQAGPVLSDFGDAAPAVTRATQALGPFSRSGTRALTSLGDAAERARGPLVRSTPLFADIETLAETGKPATRLLGGLLRSLRRSAGYDYLTRFIFYTVGSTNAYDSISHFLRVYLPGNNCVDYEPDAADLPEGSQPPPESGQLCDTNFIPATTAVRAPAVSDREGIEAAVTRNPNAVPPPALLERVLERAERREAGKADAQAAEGDSAAPGFEQPEAGSVGAGEQAGGEAGIGEARRLMDYLIGPSDRGESEVTP